MLRSHWCRHGVRALGTGRHDYVSVYGHVSLLVMFLMADHTGPCSWRAPQPPLGLPWNNMAKKAGTLSPAEQARVEA